jgi:hypothetical protein
MVRSILDTDENATGITIPKGQAKMYHTEKLAI